MPVACETAIARGVLAGGVKGWPLAFVVLLLAAPAQAAVLGPSQAPDSLGRGQEATLLFTVTGQPGELDALVLASVHADPKSNWQLKVSPDQQTLHDGESRTFEVVVHAAARPSPRTLHLTFEALVVAGSNATRLSQTVNLTASGTDLVLDRFDNPLPSPLDNVWGVFLLDVAFWLTVALVARRLVKPALRIITSRTKNKFDDALADVAGTPLFALLFVLGVKQSLEAFDLPDWAFGTMEMLARAVQIVVVAYVLYRLWYEVLHDYGRRHAARTHSRLDERLLPVLEKMGGVVIVLGALFFFIAGLGVDLTYFAASGVVISMVLAFAAQDTLSNFFSGLHLLLDQPFREGDEITLESGEVCQVARIGLRSTSLYHRGNHEMIIVPNNQLASKRVINLVKPDRRCKVTVEAGVAYGADVEVVKRALIAVARAHPDVLNDAGTEPYVRLRALGDHSLNFVLRAWIGDVRKRNQIESDLREAVVKDFAAKDIEIASPSFVMRSK